MWESSLTHEESLYTGERSEWITSVRLTEGCWVCYIAKLWRSGDQIGGCNNTYSIRRCCRGRKQKWEFDTRTCSSCILSSALTFSFVESICFNPLFQVTLRVNGVKESNEQRRGVREKARLPNANASKRLIQKGEHSERGEDPFGRKKQHSCQWVVQ